MKYKTRIMSRKCINKECIRYNIVDIDDSDDFCRECGYKLVNDSQEQTEESTKFAIDNRLDYQSGDRTVVGRDNISNQNVDNRNITTNTSNVVNNITRYETMMQDTMIECAISGKPLPLDKKIKCRRCRRYISEEFYDNKELLCVECVAEKKDFPNKQPINSSFSQDGLSTASNKIIPPLITVPAASEVPITRPVIEPINQERKVKSGRFKKVYLLITVFTIALLVYIFIPSKENLSVEESPEEVITTNNVSTINSAPKEVSVPAIATPASGKTPVKETDTNTEAAIKEISVFDQGIEAYTNGNFNQANLWLTQAAKEGNSAAHFYLAKMYQEGKGVTRSVKKSFEYMLKAAEGDYEDAYYEVAEMLRTGNGTESNRNNARKWYEKAALSKKNSDKASSALSKYY